MNEIKSVLGHVNTDLFGYDVVLFVEGDTEENAIPILASNLGIDIVNDGIRLLNSKGYGNMKQIENIIDLLKGNTTEVYALFDNHAATQGDLKDIKNRLNANNYIELAKDFEDCFDVEILIKALQDILTQENLSLNSSEAATIKQHLGSPNSKAFQVLSSAYQRTTQTPDRLSKVLLGETIAKVLATDPKHIGKSQPEDIILKMHEYVKKRLAGV